LDKEKNGFHVPASIKRFRSAVIIGETYDSYSIFAVEQKCATKRAAPFLNSVLQEDLVQICCCMQEADI
jgi:hypothetical protein